MVPKYTYYSGPIGEENMALLRQLSHKRSNSLQPHRPTPYANPTANRRPKAVQRYRKCQKVGSIGYATTITRADAAKATTVDRAITYLYTTRYLAIEYNAEVDIDSVQLASDTSYGDHTDRKSSTGYICQVYATKQRTVTTSTTEAELLGLSKAGKQLQYRVGFEASHDFTIECDNERTITLITADDTSFDTKLRHIGSEGGTRRCTLGPNSKNGRRWLDEAALPTEAYQLRQATENGRN
ncbi:uncharacterized protein N7511_008588 [Penicillium nucicola]|uniref:uncharacterized protein n=1 Tax=Penicillium nucicola TaxID=1850975 RepID=UPI002544FFEE|nr:uncharacterized protein N7511_008588 [Penicillium nucicola]KAJ5746892.1 hypothetical protein N7511_008588 [Penicillium nucicola]